MNKPLRPGIDSLLAKKLGVVHPKCEGAPVHPDDMYTANQDHYNRQLAAFKEFYRDSWWPWPGCGFEVDDACDEVMA